MSFDDSGLANGFDSAQLGLGRGAAGKGLLPRTGLVSARVERHAGSRQTIFFAIRGGEPGGRCLFERQIAWASIAAASARSVLKSPTNLSARRHQSARRAREQHQGSRTSRR